MNEKKIEIEFTKSVRDFLENKGYSHIFSLGIAPEEINDANELETGKEHYWLEPVKSGDSRLEFSKTKHIVNQINDVEILEMADGEDSIQFMIEFSIPEYEEYLKTKDI